VQTSTHQKQPHGSYLLVSLVSVAIVAIVLAGLFFLQVFKPVLSSADSGTTLGRENSSQLPSVSLLAQSWSGGEIIRDAGSSFLLKIASGKKVTTTAATQFLLNHPEESIKLCINGKSLTGNGTLAISSQSLSGASVDQFKSAFRTICVKQLVSSSVGTSESPRDWNVVQLAASTSSLLVRSVSLTATTKN
jgi:hypothetical protein